MTELLHKRHIDPWAGWFGDDLADYVAAQGPPRHVVRQRAVVEHVLMAFGGMYTFTQLQLTDEAGVPISEANERLQFLSSHLWAAARSLQGVLATVEP